MAQSFLLRRGAWRTAPVRRRKSNVMMPHGLLKQSIFTGKGYFAGMGSGIVTVDGVPARRRIYLMDCGTMRFVRGTWSAADGSYRLSHLDPDRLYLLMARDHNGQFEPVAYDFLRPHTD